jgi:hypothetical protein
MDILEQVVRSFARRTTQNGHVVLVTDHHPALVAAFQQLGWADPYPDPEQLPKPVVVDRGLTKATVSTAERAVLPSPKGRVGGV